MLLLFVAVAIAVAVAVASCGSCSCCCCNVAVANNNKAAYTVSVIRWQKAVYSDVSVVIASFTAYCVAVLRGCTALSRVFAV